MTFRRALLQIMLRSGERGFYREWSAWFIAPLLVYWFGWGAFWVATILMWTTAAAIAIGEAIVIAHKTEPRRDQ